jgi:hypothetical protein
MVVHFFTLRTQVASVKIIERLREIIDDDTISTVFDSEHGIGHYLIKEQGADRVVALFDVRLSSGRCSKPVSRTTHPRLFPAWATASWGVAINTRLSAARVMTVVNQIRADFIREHPDRDLPWGNKPTSLRRKKRHGKKEKGRYAIW